VVAHQAGLPAHTFCRTPGVELILLWISQTPPDHIVMTLHMWILMLGWTAKDANEHQLITFMSVFSRVMARFEREEILDGSTQIFVIVLIRCLCQHNIPRNFPSSFDL